MKVDAERTRLAGATGGEAKKLNAIYPPELVETMREVAGTRLHWQTTEEVPQAPDGLTGTLSVPDAQTLLSYDFAHYGRVGQDPFPSDVQVTVVDAHNDQRVAWLVVAEGGTSIQYAEEGEAHEVATTFAEYLEKGLAAWYLDYWQDPGTQLGNGLTVEGALRHLTELPLTKAVEVEVFEMDELGEAEAKRWLKDAIAAIPPNHGRPLKALKARKKSIPDLAAHGLRRLRLRIDAPGTLSLGGERSLAVLLDAPGAASLLEACGGADPRFDWNWGPEITPHGIVGVRHHVERPADFGPAVLDVEMLLLEALCPVGAITGARFEAVLPYT